MALTFDIGDADRPKGHAIVYFQSPTTSEVIATYVLILPIPMDIGKYLPPLLAAQLGGMAGEAMGEGMGSFAAPPMPEAVESVGFLRDLASLRGDDLVSGGSVVLGDPAAAMQTVRSELAAYGEGLADKPQLVALNKLDLADAELGKAFADELLAAGADKVFNISGATGEGMEELLDGVLSYLPDRTSTETQAEEVEDEADEPDWSPI